MHLEAAVYFLTYSVVEWLPVFVSDKTCKVLAESLVFCHRQKQLRINAYVFMPTHLHLIAFDADFKVERLEHTLADFRKFTGRRVSDLCAGHRVFAQALREQATADRDRRFWQPSRHPEALLTERFWRQKLDYLHDNPCRKGLVRQPEHWRFSSAAFYLSDGQVPCDIPITPVEW